MDFGTVFIKYEPNAKLDGTETNLEYCEPVRGVKGDLTRLIEQTVK